MPVVNKQTATTTPRPTLSSRSEGVSVWDQVQALRVLVWGQSGTGKSTFAATFPDPILWLLCSGGNKPGELKSIDTPENRRRITPRVVTDTGQMRDYVRQAPEYPTTVLDHGSGLADLVLKELLGLDEIPVQKGWGTASQQVYGQMAQQCKEWFRELLNLPGNVVIICQERTFGGKEDGGDPELVRPTVGPALTPSLAGWLCPAVDYVVGTFKKPRMEQVRATIGGKEHITERRGKGVDYCLRTGPHDVQMTKFRVPKGTPLPEYLVDPTYTSILEVIKGQYKP